MSDIHAIRTGITQRRKIQFAYRGEACIVEPHVLGESLQGMKIHLHGYDTGAQPPQWRYFAVEEMGDIAIIDETFTPRLDPDEKIGHWAEVYAATDFD